VSVTGLHMPTARTADCAAPASLLYELVADPTWWPVLFASTLDVRALDRSGGAERFEVCELVDGGVQRSVLRREADPARMAVAFLPEGGAPLAERVWELRPRGAGSRIVLHRPDDADGTAAAELEALRRLGGSGHPVDDLVFSFADRVALPVGVGEAYGFVFRSDRWPEVLPHVSRVALAEPQPGVQDMEMDTVTRDGHTHTTRSVRLCRPAERIAYKQLVPPALLLGHSGVWEFAEVGDGTVVTSRHSVAINPAAVAAVLGPDRTPTDARIYLRDVLGANSRATLSHAGRVPT
jgi:aromatase